MNAEVISVGTELLLGQIVDTDAPLVAQTLSRYGISLYHRTTVGDNHDRLLETLKTALSRANIVITIGGVGPTMDDITKQTVAEALEVPLVSDVQHREWLEKTASARGRTNIPETYFKQADIPAQGRGIPNTTGTALGAIFESQGKVAICLPGPPNELIPMLNLAVEPYLAEKVSGERIVIQSRVLRIVGMGEPVVEEKIADLIPASNPTVAPYAKTGEVHLRITARAPDESAARKLTEPVEAEIRKRLGDTVYGTDAETLESVVVRLLTDRGLTVAAAESCSGGLIAKRITDVPDSSKVFGLGLVTYSNEAKMQFLGVPEADLAAHGAVSPEVARQMALGARKISGADLAVSVTGIAGPSGGTDQKPVGTVHVGFAWPGGVVSEHHQFLGGRADIAYRSSQAALALIRTYLVRPEEPRFAHG